MIQAPTMLGSKLKVTGIYKFPQSVFWRAIFIHAIIELCGNIHASFSAELPFSFSGLS
jgi:hypothetical protein